MCQRFRKVIQILHNLNQPDRVAKRNSTNFIKLMGFLNNPHKSFKSIHITGTNGKGSVAIKIAKALESAGYKTGIYTSPHLFSFRQRIQINGENISREDISNYIIHINQISQQKKIDLSYFQYLTASGFLHFQAQKCHYVSLQVGLGGNNDTTNVVTPEISVITSIGLDHMQLLGPTKEHIARQKAGIIKDKRPVVLGPAAQGYTGIEQAIIQKQCDVFRVDNKFEGADFELQNNLIVRKSFEALKFCDDGIKVTQKDIEKGLQAKQLCRMELLDCSILPKSLQDKKYFFDVGHNPSAIKKVKVFVKNLGYKSSEICFIFGTSSKKNITQILPEIQEIAGKIYLIQANHFRAMPISELQQYVGQSKNPQKYRCLSNGKIDSTLKQVSADPACKVVVVSGSFFIMNEARGYFQPSLTKFPEQNINQIYDLYSKPIH